MKLRMALIIIVLILFSVVALMVRKNYQSRYLTAQGDRTTVSRNLDGLVKVDIPASFELDQQNLLETYHGYWGLSEGKSIRTFTYYFTKGAHTNIGGTTIESIILGIEIFASSSDITAIAPASTTNPEGYPLVYPRRTFMYTQGDLEKLSIPQGEIDRVRAHSGDAAANGTLLYYTSAKEPYRVSLFYENGKLDDKAALNLIQQIIPTIKIQSDLIGRIQAITEDFYRQNPDKRPK